MTDAQWMAPEVRQFIKAHEARYEALNHGQLDALVHTLVADHERLVDHQCINLYAGTNMQNPRAARMLASSIGGRPSLGHPGDKYNKGMVHAEQIEIILSQLLRRLFDAKFVETRVASGSLANLYAFMATCKPGDSIMSFSDAAAGHPTHHEIGAAGLYGLKVHEVPFDATRMDVDVPALRSAALVVRPKLIVVAGSMCLFPYSVSEVRAVANEVGAYVLYDAAHMGGLIAGKAFQQPLAEGADLMTGSTYKSFGGPPSGMILTNSAELAGRLDRIAYPGLTANFDLSRTAAMCIAVLDLLEFGQAYAAQCIANAQALAKGMAVRGVDVFELPGRGHTASQHVAIRAQRYGGGNHASRRAEAANILFTSIGLPGPQLPGEANAIRIGTQEVTRWGMREADMDEVAALIARILVDGHSPTPVKPDVLRLRERFQELHYIRN
jgi:glycine hydroxymethyltransferase